MLLAKSESGEPIEATKNKIGLCPGCGEKLIPKMGIINIHHWAHKSCDCDSFGEHETRWHYEWKKKLGLKNCEIIVKNESFSKYHRADAIIDGYTIELQNSPISPLDIILRESFYGEKMIWIFNALTLGKGIELRTPENNSKNYFTFRWKHPAKSLWTCERPMFFDFGTKKLFRIKKLYPNIPCGGWGVFVDLFIDD